MSEVGLGELLLVRRVEENITDVFMIQKNEMFNGPEPDMSEYILVHYGKLDGVCEIVKEEKS